ncbi:hypothetical protein IC235_15120 [Hymenobacter sp. BT664]|uniref:Outer membrane lipoprotein-sorting protein n=1 Tax=Hymenobacter montanus TaxID=2771359 RepID=A0A927BE85_9BACT|nr:hypothetical protein [Hymenobacter montanus]MBD2769221.1 hypothetical protein [Hymenobacter montanus]
MRARFLMTVALVLWAGTSLRAQDLKQAVTRMQKLYSQSNRLHVVMRIEAFEKETATTPYYQEQADIKREGANYWYLFGTTEMLLNARFIVMVDKSAREMMFNTRKPGAGPSFQAAKAPNLDSLFRFYEDPQYLGRKGHTDHYRVVQKKGPVDRIDLLIDGGTGFLSEIRYRYRQGPLVAIHFLTFDPQPRFGPDVFAEARYITRSGGTVQPAVSFKHYHLSQSEGL